VPSSDRPLDPCRVRLDPERLRDGTPALAAADRIAEDNTGQKLILAILAQTEWTLGRRKSFWEVIANYNPLGQFGAAHADNTSVPRSKG